MKLSRKEAKRRGIKWYYPDNPCPKCGTNALRYVANGRCTGCHPSRQAVSETMIIQSPDMVITRVQSESMGLIYYRTPDEPCPIHGTAWRKTSTGECLDCHRTVASISPKRMRGILVSAIDEMERVTNKYRTMLRDLDLDTDK